MFFSLGSQSLCVAAIVGVNDGSVDSILICSLKDVFQFQFLVSSGIYWNLQNFSGPLVEIELVEDKWVSEFGISRRDLQA